MDVCVWSGREFVDGRVYGDESDDLLFVPALTASRGGRAGVGLGRSG